MLRIQGDLKFDHYDSFFKIMFQYCCQQKTYFINLKLKLFSHRTSPVTACSVGVFWFVGPKSSRRLSGLRELSRRPEREFSPFWMKHK